MLPCSFTSFSTAQSLVLTCATSACLCGQCRALHNSVLFWQQALRLLAGQVQEVLEDAEIAERLRSMRKYAKDTTGTAEFPIPPPQPPQLSPEYNPPLKSWVDETDEIVLSR